MPRAYEGDQPYIFISYSHRDSAIVMKVIHALQAQNIRVWYDGGIEAGSEWPEYIASHLKNCECVLSFISEHFVNSMNCRREMIFAQDERKPMMNVFVDEVELSDGMRMQLGLNQAIWKKNFPTDEAFCDAICRARILSACKEPEKEAPIKPAATPVVTEPEPATVVKEETPKAKEKKPIPPIVPIDTKARKFFTWLTVLLELSYILFGTLSLSAMTGKDHGFWLTVLVVCGSHIAIIIINRLIIKIAGKRLPEKTLSGLSTSLFLTCAVSSVLAVVIGTFYVGYDIHGILKFLVSLGFNIVPAAVGIVAYSLCD